MKSIVQLMGTLTIVSALPGAFAQQVPTPPPEQNTFFFTTAAPVGAEHAFEYVASGMRIEGGVVKNAPYSAQAVTETTQQLVDGNRISRKTTASLYRDSEGRTRREETLGAIGTGAQGGEPAQSIFINDPVAQSNMVLDTRNKLVHKLPKMKFPPPPMGAGGPVFFSSTGTAGAVSLSDADPMKMKRTAEFDSVMIQKGLVMGGADQNVQKESLGTQTIEGVQAEGTRTTLTIPAGAIGNDRPIQVVSERWYSPELQTVVMSKHSDPRMGDTTYRLTGINRGEPAPSLFQAPADYTAASGDKRLDEQRFQMKTIVK